MTKKIIDAIIMEISPYEFDCKLADIIHTLEDLRKEHGDECWISWDRDNWPPYHLSPSPTFWLMHRREETDEEHEKRIKQETEKKRLQETKEKAEFERLKSKFGE